MNAVKSLFLPGNKKKMLRMLAALVALVILDGIITEVLLAQGIARESNPLLAPIVGDAIFMVLKVVGAAICSLILWDVYRNYPKAAVIATWCAIFVYSGIVLWNSSLFLLV